MYSAGASASALVFGTRGAVKLRSMILTVDTVHRRVAASDYACRTDNVTPISARTYIDLG